MNGKPTGQSDPQCKLTEAHGPPEGSLGAYSYGWPCFSKAFGFEVFLCGGLGDQGAKIFVPPKGICFSIPPKDFVFVFDNHVELESPRRLKSLKPLGFPIGLKASS